MNSKEFAFTVGGVVLGIIIASVVGGFAATDTSPTDSAEQQPEHVQVVEAYYEAVESDDMATAYRLSGGDNENAVLQKFDRRVHFFQQSNMSVGDVRSVSVDGDEASVTMNVSYNVLMDTTHTEYGFNDTTSINFSEGERTPEGLYYTDVELERIDGTWKVVEDDNPVYIHV